MRCPRALDRSGSVILMEYFGDAYRGAPTLIEVSLEMETAERLLADCLAAVELMLEDFIIHGDLSAYNILLWEGEAVVIDLPQVVDPMANPAAREIFERDVQRVCQYFGQQGVSTDWREVTDEIWWKHID